MREHTWVIKGQLYSPPPPPRHECASCARSVGWMGTVVALVTWDRRKISCFYWETNHDFPVVRPLMSSLYWLSYTGLSLVSTGSVHLQPSALPRHRVVFSNLPNVRSSSPTSTWLGVGLSQVTLNERFKKYIFRWRICGEHWISKYASYSVTDSYCQCLAGGVRRQMLALTCALFHP